MDPELHSQFTSVDMGNVQFFNETGVTKAHHDKQQKAMKIFGEPFDTPGLVPVHQKRAVTVGLPILEIMQRLLYRLRPRYNLDMVLAAIALYQAGMPVYKYLKDVFLRLSTSQVVVPYHDPVAKEVLAWMSANVMSKSSTTKAMILTGTAGAGSFDSESYYRQRFQRGGQPMQVSDEVQCLPPVGSSVFWVGFRPFWFHLVSGTTSGYGTHMGNYGQQTSAINLWTLGWSLQPLQDFIKTCHALKLTNKNGTTTIYFASGGSSMDGGYGVGVWQSVTKAVRKLDTIDIPEDIKTDLVKDVDYYYSVDAEKFYADCGIPYRRGYLFHGPPGTGKTSLSAALAGHLSCDLYMINLAAGDVSDEKLHRLFLALPKKCVVVIEDVDSAGIGREQEAALLPHPHSEDAPETPSVIQRFMAHGGAQHRQRAKVTLSGLLNAIDGNASQEGRLLIMTSNNPDALDEALTRPGRIDKSILFGKITRPSAVAIFVRLVGRAAIATGKYNSEEIAHFAAEFSEQLPVNTFTPAHVQNYLQTCRGDPQKALKELAAWLETNIPKAVEGQQGNDRKVNDANLTTTKVNGPQVNGKAATKYT